jgi:hypothetical protein
VFGRATFERLLRRSQSRFREATIYGSSKIASAPLFFTQKRFLQKKRLAMLFRRSRSRSRNHEGAVPNRPKNLNSQKMACLMVIFVLRWLKETTFICRLKTKMTSWTALFLLVVYKLCPTGQQICHLSSHRFVICRRLVRPVKLDTENDMDKKANTRIMRCVMRAMHPPGRVTSRSGCLLTWRTKGRSASVSEDVVTENLTFASPTSMRCVAGYRISWGSQ